MFRLTKEYHLFTLASVGVTDGCKGGAVQTVTLAGNLLFLPDKLAGDLSSLRSLSAKEEWADCARDVASYSKQVSRER